MLFNQHRHRTIFHFQFSPQLHGTTWRKGLSRKAFRCLSGRMNSFSLLLSLKQQGQDLKMLKNLPLNGKSTGKECSKSWHAFHLLSLQMDEVKSLWWSIESHHLSSSWYFSFKVWTLKILKWWLQYYWFSFLVTM